MPSHYYDACEVAATSAERAAGEWAVLKAFTQAGLAAWGEACVLECREDAGKCKMCRFTARLAWYAAFAGK